ncbi:hypothetical protein KP509_37G060300 [Ceratopteris richardii]|nr:hypothetical protein KP509_37G060300 [Ceratopteris richardii]
MEGRDNRDILNSVLCDELLAEILCKVQDPVDSESVSLACKRWQRVQRMAKSKLGLLIPSDITCAAIFAASAPSLLEQHRYITSLSIKSKCPMPSGKFVLRVVSAIASSCRCLTQIHFTAGPLSNSSLEELARGCPYLKSLDLLYPLSVKFPPRLHKFAELRELTFRGHNEDSIYSSESEDYAENSKDIHNPSEVLKLVKVSLVNMRSCTSFNLRWLWISSSQIQKLKLSNCDTVGDTGDMSSFAYAISHLKELKLLRCRGIAGQVMMLAAKHSPKLKVLTVHDGADTEGMHMILQNCRKLEVLDLRLPLDLSRDDLMMIGQHGKCLHTLRLHSCWMATGADMQMLAHNINSNLSELVLIRCRAIFQDSGTLSCMGQNLSNLKCLDLSENEYLADKELAGILAANAHGMRHLNLWKCCRLTDKVLDFITWQCVSLKSLDIRSCDGMSMTAVSNLVKNCHSISMLAIEPNKLSSEARRFTFSKHIAIIDPKSSRFIT